MEVAVTVIVGFGAAVLGAAVAFLGALHLDRRRVGRTRVGIVRAVVGELMQNVTTITSGFGAEEGATRYSSETWRAANFELAQFLDQELYQKVLFLYMTLPVVEQASRLPPETPDRKGVFSLWLERAWEALDGLLKLRETSGLLPTALETVARLKDQAKSVTSGADGLATGGEETPGR